VAGIPKLVARRIIARVPSPYRDQRPSARLVVHGLGDDIGPLVLPLLVGRFPQLTPQQNSDYRLSRL
jgi:hypothetical protein